MALGVLKHIPVGRGGAADAWPRVLAAAAVLLILLGGHAPGEEPVTAGYDASDRTLLVSIGGKPRFRYGFNKGGAVNRIVDLLAAPGKNLIGESFQGETTDRVIQWTYWNARYEADPHKAGDGDVRANATMEGSFHEKATCQVLSTPKSGNGLTWLFRSKINHWFYSNLDKHGTPDFETTTTYRVLPDGSLKLTRAVLRRPWRLKNVHVKTWNGKGWSKTKVAQAVLEAKHERHRSMTSYFEGWSPFRRTILPKQKHGKGVFDQDGYRFWKPQDLGGWAMAYGDAVGVALVFGETEFVDNGFNTHVVFNKMDLPRHRLNVLQPAIQTDWPDHSVLTQELILVVGEPKDAARRADRLVGQVAAPSVVTSRKPAAKNP